MKHYFSGILTFKTISCQKIDNFQNYGGAHQKYKLFFHQENKKKVHLFLSLKFTQYMYTKSFANKCNKYKFINLK